MKEYSVIRGITSMALASGLVASASVSWAAKTTTSSANNESGAAPNAQIQTSSAKKSKKRRNKKSTESASTADSKSNTNPQSSVAPAGNSIAAPTSGAAANSSATSGNVSSLNANAIAKQEIKRAYSLGLVSVMDGPAVSGKGGKQPDGSAINTHNQLSLGYKLNDKISTGLALNADYAPGTGQPAGLKDTFLRASTNRIASISGSDIGGELRVYIPTSNASRASNKITQVRMALTNEFRVNRSRWSIANAAYAQPYFYSKKNATSPNLKLYYNPSIGYQIRSNLAFALGYEIDGLATSSLLKYNDGDPNPLTASLSWDVNSRLNLVPALSITPAASKVGLDTTQLGLTMSLKLL